MSPIGYLCKNVVKTPGWLKVQAVADIYSLSGCVSRNFADYVNYWRHNGYWLFDSPSVIEDIARQEGIDLTVATLFYYEAYKYEFDATTREWIAFGPEPSFITDVQSPTTKNLEGFDVVTFAAHTSPECSPLSCNSLATDIPVNEHCLFRTFAEAKKALELGLFNRSEPGPYRIVAVYTVAAPASSA